MLKFVPNINDGDEQSHFVQIGKFLLKLISMIFYTSIYFKANSFIIISRLLESVCLCLK
jgi:hypothetical protein